MSPIPHVQLPINSITNITLSISHYKHPYVTPLTHSVTNQFHYKYYAVHLTLESSLFQPSHTFSYQSIPLPILCSPSHTIDVLISPLPHDQLPINSITNTMLSNSHYKHPYVTPTTRSVTNQLHYQCYAVHLTLKHPHVTPHTRSVTNQFHYQCYAVHITL
jgi:hypothetical protein